MRAPSHTRSASGALTLSVLHASTPKLVSSHPRCHTIDSLPFMTKFFASSHSADRCPSPLFHAVHVARGPSQVGRRPRPHLCLGRTLLYIELINPLFRTFSLSPFVLVLPLSIPETPLSLRPFYHLGHRTSILSSAMHPSSCT